MWTSLFSAGVLACIVGWYFFWIPYLNDTFGYGDHFTTGCPLLSMGWDEIKSEWPRILQKLYIVPMEYVGFLLFIGSIIYILWRRQWVVLMLFLIPYLCFLLVILKTGKSIISDQYYILCVIPVMAFVAGYGLAQVPNRKIMLFVLTAVVVENIIGQRKDFRRHRSNTQFENLESIVDRFSKRNDLFAINSDPHCPTVMYWAHRKGWTFRGQELTSQAIIDDTKAKGCKYILITKLLYEENRDLKLDLPQLYEDEYFRIYELNK